jgi:hypothetical protein
MKWRYWQDAWLGLLFVACVAFGFWLATIIVDCAEPTKLIGYNIHEITSSQMAGAVRYEVHAVRTHTFTRERTVATVSTYDEAITLIRALEALGERG